MVLCVCMCVFAFPQASDYKLSHNYFKLIIYIEKIEITQNYTRISGE